MKASRMALALVFILIPLSSSADLSVSIDGVNPILGAPGQVRLQVAWKWPPWGANIRAEYGPTASYGSATEWVSRSGFPFSGTTELVLNGLPDGAVHYRIVASPTDGPPGQDTYVGGDQVVTPASSAVDLCQRNCPDNDANCRNGCVGDSEYFNKALAACTAKCRADDPDCQAICHNNLNYASNPPTVTAVVPSYTCPAGWQLHHVFARMDFNCHPLGSDFCKDKQSFTAKYSTVCVTPPDANGNQKSMSNDVTTCQTRRGAATRDPSAGGNWWQTALGAWECVGTSYGNCRILCPQ